MNSFYKPPMAIHFVWHPSDAPLVEPVLGFVKDRFARDVDYPFSRGLNIPLFYYSSAETNRLPQDAPNRKAEKNIVFAFVSTNTLGRDQWQLYIDNICSGAGLHLVPIAVDNTAIGQGGSDKLRSLNFLRLYEWPTDLRNEHALLAMAHEVYRLGFSTIKPDDKGKCSSIQIFLSHAKSCCTGKSHATSIRKFIDETNMTRFFDATDIAPGFEFDGEILQHIRTSTLVAIGSDSYSSRYWCQREIMSAKTNDRPMVYVNCLSEYEDRIFPDGANVPCVHVSQETPLKETDILRVLISTILETIRYLHAKESLEIYKAQRWIDNDCAVSSRPPEVRQAIKLQKDGKSKICYPEPPVYPEESAWLADLGIEAFTPLWKQSEGSTLAGLRIGISISDIVSGADTSFDSHNDYLKRFAQDIARHLLARSATIIYGGDLRANGFTEFILNEAIALKNRISTKGIHVENHLAWPLYLSEAEVVAWRAKYSPIMRSVERGIPKDIEGDVDKNSFTPPNSDHNKYIWSRCLTSMREESISSSTARICAGGKLAGYKGKMPGVLEEISIALDKGKPIYLVGAFGGVVGEVCQTILGSSVTEPLTETWQITHNSGYASLQQIAKPHNMSADYGMLKAQLEGLSIDSVAQRSGLSSAEYRRLMETPFVDECVHLILKGLKGLV